MYFSYYHLFFFEDELFSPRSVGLPKRVLRQGVPQQAHQKT